MTDTKMEIWDALKTPPDGATKEITGGRLSGKTDINPQWRLEAMTRQFGPCGVGWRYTIKKLWTVDAGVNGEVAAFAEIDVYTRIKDVHEHGEWSQPIPGIGGNMFVEQEKGGPHVSDECFKMAVTDALSVAFKALGVAADVYMGKFDSKYDQRGGKAGGGQRRKREPKDEGLGTCEKCGTFMKKVVLKDGSGRWFMGCQAYPDCKYTKWPDKKEKPEAASAATSGTQAAPPGPRPLEAAPSAQEPEEMCPMCGRHPINPDGYCPNEGGGQPQAAPAREAEPEWRPQCCGRSMMPRAGFEGEPPFWQCPRRKEKRTMTEEERKRVGL